MKLTVNTAARTIVREADGRKVEMDLFSVEAFEEISALWLKLGWNAKYPYTFSWMGRPVIQIPEDMVRLQEVIYRVKPDVLVETGVAATAEFVAMHPEFEPEQPSWPTKAHSDATSGNGRACAFV